MEGCTTMVCYGEVRSVLIAGPGMWLGHLEGEFSSFRRLRAASARVGVCVGCGCVHACTNACRILQMERATQRTDGRIDDPCRHRHPSGYRNGQARFLAVFVGVDDGYGAALPAVSAITKPFKWDYRHSTKTGRLS